MEIYYTITPPGRNILRISVSRGLRFAGSLLLRFMTPFLAAVIFFHALPLPAADDSIHLYQQGLEAMRAGNYRSAELLFSKVIKKDDAMRDNAWFSLAQSLFYQKRYTAAVFEFNRFIVICTDDSLRNESLFWIAESHYFNSEYILSIEEYRRFINEIEGFAGHKTTSYMRIASIYSRQNRYAESLQELHHALDIAPTKQSRRQVIYTIAETHFLNRDFNSSRVRITELLSPDEGDYYGDLAQILSARILLARSEFNEALNTLFNFTDERIAERNLQDVYYFRAKAATLLDGEKAIADFQQYIESSPDGGYSNEAYFEIGSILFNRARYAEALPYFMHVADNAATPQVALREESLYYTSFILFLAKDNTRARSYLEVIPEENMNYLNKEYYILKSDNYVAMGLYKLSEELLIDMSEAYRYDPELDRILYKLAYTQLLDKKYTKSRATFEQIHQIDPFSEYIGESSYYIALAYYEQGDVKRAATFFSTYLSANSDRKNELDALHHYSNTLLVLKRYSESERILNRLIAKYPNHEKCVQAVHSYLIESETGRNSAFFQYVLKYFPRTFYAYDLLRIQAAEYYAKKDYLHALEIYSRIVNEYSDFSENEDFYCYLVCLKQLGKEYELINSLKSYKFTGEWESDKVIPLLAEVYEKRENDTTALSLRLLQSRREFDKIVIYLLEMGSYEQAYDIYKQMPVTPEKYGLFLTIEQFCLEKELYSLLIPYGELIIDEAPFSQNRPVISFLLCRHSLRAADYARAEKYIPQYEKGGAVESHLLRTEVLFCVEKYQEIVREYNSRINDQRYLARVLYSCVQSKIIGYAPAIAAALEKQSSKSYEVSLSLINYYNYGKNINQLKPYIRNSRDPLYTMAAYYAACIYYERKDYSGFSEVCTQLKNSGGADIYYDRTMLIFAEYLLDKGEAARAQDAVGHVLSSPDLSLRNRAQIIVTLADKYEN